MAKNAYIKGKSKKAGVIFTAAYQKEGDAFLAGLEAGKYSKASIDNYTRALRKFFLFLAAHAIGKLQDVTSELLEQYRFELISAGFKYSSLDQYIRSVRLFFRRLEKTGVVFSDPSYHLVNVRYEKRLPVVPSEAEMKKLLGQPNVGTPAGVRDRALLEVCYATGVRVHELYTLDVRSLDLPNGVLRVFGKGRKERILPLGKHARSWLDRYLHDARNALLGGAIDCPALWVDQYGRRLSKGAIAVRLTAYSRQAAIKHISVHGIRRACATHMLANGAHPVQIQILLGHASLRNLSQYLQLTVTDLKKTHGQSRLGK
jgi:integrase/recombinase XerD